MTRENAIVHMILRREELKNSVGDLDEDIEAFDMAIKALEQEPVLDKIRAEIDNFVSFLIRENCEGCKECEPRLSADWKPKFTCVEEGRAKWLLSMAEKYKAENEQVGNPDRLEGE